MITLVLALPLLGLALLAVLRIPHGVLWVPAVAATEWGHALAVIALVVATPWDPSLAGRAGTLLALAAALFFASPMLRAKGVDVDGALRGFGDVLDRPPVRFRNLGFGIRFPRVPVKTEDLPHDRKMDLYGIEPGARKPLVVAVHGGSWNAGDRTQLSPIYQWLAARGWAVAAIEYRLAPANPYPAALDDIHATMNRLKERHAELGIDPERVVLYGRSAGGHLALLAAYRYGGVKAVVALYPVTDMHWSWENPTPMRIIDTPGTLVGFLGGPRDEKAQIYTEASPIEWVTPSTPPTLILHGSRDELVYLEQSERLARRLDQDKIRHGLIRLPWATHGCEANIDGPSGQILRYALERFLAGV